MSTMPHPSSSSSAAVADAMMNHICHLLDLIESRDWTAFDEIALSNARAFKIVSGTISEREEFNGMTLLHAIVRHDPPVSLLRRMIELHPRALAGRDCLGRTPLHVAAGGGASPRVMKVLTAGYPEACTIQDEDGRTPLHFACDASCELFEDDGDGERCDRARGPPSLDAVRVLLSGSLDAVVLEDVDETNAVEYAIMSDAPIEVVNLLQKATQRVLMRRSSKKEANGCLSVAAPAIRAQ